MLRGKTVMVGVTGGIAAYKTAALCSMLVKQGADVHAVMTESAVRFVAPLTFETLTGNRAVTDMFDRNFEWDVKHISLAKSADLIIISPCTANTLAKLVSGIADNMLTATVLAADCPKLLSPSMNTGMLANPVTRDNIKKAREYGFTVIDPVCGRLACGDVGEGKSPEPEYLLESILREIARQKDLAGKRILITAGGTAEALDPVRYIGNRSSGRMGCAIARAAMLRGADVTLIHGVMDISPPSFVTAVAAESARDMFAAVQEHYADMDIIIKAAAVADYTPALAQEEKIKKSAQLTIELQSTDDIALWLGQNKRPEQILVGFAAETCNTEQNAMAKLQSKNLDMIVANQISADNPVFGNDYNRAAIIGKDGIQQLERMSKSELADVILDGIGGNHNRRAFLGCMKGQGCISEDFNEPISV
ncbi:MAG: bifunctional phosphopantothenoylcysteine decarboxylase/phosphopantothenate--cysteine ligase CoaBC [Oscillospiraceae bacterium]|nr:bifunctional phosphopantothenoylcysteine decarboxylase/phosphopantothenate--cysteine ligase CoaBC [Oscillospiraceae bacterium]